MATRSGLLAAIAGSLGVFFLPDAALARGDISNEAVATLAASILRKSLDPANSPKQAFAWHSLFKIT